MKKGIGRQEAQVLAYSQMRSLRTLRTGDLRKPLELSASQERKVLSRLSRAGMIARAWRGVYLVPPRLPLGGKWSPGEFLALATVMETIGATFQICGPSAFSRYGYDDQVPNRTYAYNNRISGERRVGGVTLMLIKVADKRLGGTEPFQTPDGDSMVYASRARTLLDAVYDWSRFNSLPRAYEWIRTDLAAGRVTERDLVQVTLRYGDIGTIRRMGLLLERENVAPPLLRKLKQALPATTSLIAWVPRQPKRGRINRAWGIVENDAGREQNA